MITWPYTFQIRSNWFAFLTAATILLACNPHPGFEETPSGLYKRLDQFGDCSPDFTDAEYFILNIDYHSLEKKEKASRFQIYHHNVGNNTGAFVDTNLPGLRIQNELDSLKCGDKCTFILPFSEIDHSFLCSQSDSTNFRQDEQIEFTVHLLRTFHEDEFYHHLMHAAQQQELSEPEAIEILLSNLPDITYEKHGDCFIQFLSNENGDSIKPGREVHLRYNTFLLNQKQLDTITEMQFSFGKPGQLIGGLQYALSFLTEHDRARIFLPSYLAFGEEGNSSGLVPAHTPVIMDVEVLQVD